MDHGAHSRLRDPTAPDRALRRSDIRGAVTIRQQLDKHRSNASCATCHSKIDPAGFALESCDVLGGWRDRYRRIDETVPAVKGRARMDSPSLSTMPIRSIPPAFFPMAGVSLRCAI
jgi:Protein of unknown function (DUF1588)